MSDEFNPYYEWLAIPLEEQPANFYRLLGVKEFESNPKILQNAADRQMTHVRTFQQGKHAAESQTLLNELAKARITLLDPTTREAYNETMRQTISVVPPMTSGNASGSILLDLPSIQLPNGEMKKKGSQFSWLSSFWVWGAGVTLLLVLILIYFQGENTAPAVGVTAAKSSFQPPLNLEEKEAEETVEPEEATDMEVVSEKDAKPERSDESEELDESETPEEPEKLEESVTEPVEEEEPNEAVLKEETLSEENVFLTAVAGDGGIIDILDGKTLKLIHRLEGDWGLVRTMNFSPDGKKLVSGGTDGIIRRSDGTNLGRFHRDNGSELSSATSHSSNDDYAGWKMDLCRKYSRLCGRLRC